MKILNQPHVWRHCFVPARRVRQVLWIAGCDEIDVAPGGGVAVSATITTKMEYAAQTRKRMSSDAYNIASAKMESLRRARERRKRPPEEDLGEQA